MIRLQLPKLVMLALLALQQGVMAQENPLPPKPPGVLRIGLVQPRVQTGTAEAAQAAGAIRNMLGEYLRGPTIEVALLLLIRDNLALNVLMLIFPLAAVERWQLGQ